MKDICVLYDNEEFGIGSAWFHDEESAFNWASKWAKEWPTDTVTVVIDY